MANSNSITIVGNITSEPELRFTPSGAANTKFGVAVNRKWKDRSDQWQEQVSFFNVVLWQEQAENASTSLLKGARVIVTGRLEQRSYEDKDGVKKSVVEIIADEVGPSLRWASASVTKNERKEGSGSYGGGNQSSAPKEQAQVTVPNYDEFGDEPF
jgi:single-strand DNA-binding protein